MQVLVSVIVPVYGVEDYLERCVDSLLRQTHTGLEIILIDDESLDNCPEICDAYAKQDARIKVIHKKNGGLSDARNEGIAVASGEYIAFVDGDDYVAGNFIEALLDACIQQKADISCSGFYRVYGKNEVEALKIGESRTFSNLEAIEDIFRVNSRCEVMTWNKLYKRSLFVDNDITFPVGKLHEDNFTTYKLFYFAKKIAFVNRPLYYYIQRSDSIMGRTFNKKRMDILEVPAAVGEFFAIHDVAMPEAVQSMKVLISLAVYNDYLVSGVQDTAIETRIRSALAEIGPVLNNSMISSRHKVFVWLAINQTWLYALIRRTHRS